jgi:hypothetical protein
MSVRKIVVALVIILVATGGFIAGLYLLQQRQDIREEAAVPGGDATVSIEPSSGTYNVGELIQANVSFNTANIAISGVAVRLSYAFSGATPEVRVSSIDINPAITSSSDWTCPTKSSSEQAGEVIIDVACANISASGFTSNGDMLLATITLSVDRAPALGSVTLRFDPQDSIITRKTTGEDILLIPSSTGSYTISGGATNSPSPTSQVTTTITPTTTVTKTPTPTRTTTVTPTSTTSATPTTAQLPDAGVSYPTILGVGAGIMVILAGILLAL